MKAVILPRTLFPRQLLLVLLASAVAIPTLAQQGQSSGAPVDRSSSQGWTVADPQSTPPATVEQQPSPTPSLSPSSNAPKDREGFWGRVNPFARKKWVNNRVDPLKGRLNELDEVNARNGRDIQDVDRRAQAGISLAQSRADAANQLASNAGSQAQNADITAQGASGHVDRLNTTVNGLDQYHQATEVEIAFHGGQPVLRPAARKQLDDFAANLAGRKGYIVEVEGYSPQAGISGIQSSRRLTEAVNRYLVVEHEIPVYRLRSVALGNAPVTGLDSDSDETKPVKVSCVRIRLMENSLAAREAASLSDAATSTGAERP